MIKVYIWTSIERFGTNFVSLIGNIILARILVPEDFGIIGMIAIFNVIAFTLADSGLSDSLVRKKVVSDLDYSTIFYFNIFIGVVISLIIFCVAPSVAILFEKPELVLLLRFYSLGSIVSSLSIVPMAKLRKELKPKRIAIISLLSTFGALLVGVGVALSGLGYWSIAFQQVSFAIFLFFNFLVFSEWKPRLLFSFKVLKEHLSVSVNFLLGYLVNKIGVNITTSFIGKYFPLNITGHFSQSQKINEVISHSTEASLVTSSFIIVSADNNPRKKFEEILQFLFVFLPIIFGFASLASKELVFLLFGIKWIPIWPILSILFIQSIFVILTNYYYSFLKLSNNPSIIWKVSAVEKILMIIILFLSFEFGLYVMLMALLIVSVLNNIILSLIIDNVCKTKIFPQNVKLLIPLFLVFLVIMPMFYIRETYSLSSFYGYLFLACYCVFFILIGEFFHIKEYTCIKTKFINRFFRN